MSVCKFSIERVFKTLVATKDEGEYHYTYDNGFEEGGGFLKSIDEVLETIKEIVEEDNEDD